MSRSFVACRWDDLRLLRDACRGRHQRLRTQQHGVVGAKVGGASQELGDRGELVGIETLPQRGHVSSEWFHHVVDLLHPPRHGVEELLPPIAWVWLASYVPGALQP